MWHELLYTYWEPGRDIFGSTAVITQRSSCELISLFHWFMNGKEKAEHTRRTTTNQFVYHRAGNQEEINCMKGFWREPCETELFHHWLPVVIGVILGRMTLRLLFWIILLCAVWVYPGLNKRVELMSCMKAKRHIRIEMSKSLILFMSILSLFLNHFFPALYSFSQRWWLAHNHLLDRNRSDNRTHEAKLNIREHKQLSQN